MRSYYPRMRRRSSYSVTVYNRYGDYLFSRFDGFSGMSDVRYWVSNECRRRRVSGMVEVSISNDFGYSRSFRMRTY